MIAHPRKGNRVTQQRRGGLSSLRAERAQAQERHASIRKAYLALPETERLRLQHVAMTAAKSDFIRQRIRRKGIDEHVAPDVLDQFARQTAF